MKPKYHNYRKYYEYMTKEKITTNTVVHHLDGDRFNCEIENLIAISKITHYNEHKNLIHIYNGTLPHINTEFDLERYNTTKKEYEEAIINRDKKLNKALKVCDENEQK